MDEVQINRFPKTKKALAEYDKEIKLIGDMSAVITEKDLERWEISKRIAINKVRKAFYEDTKHFNSLDRCMIVSIDFLKTLFKER